MRPTGRCMRLARRVTVPALTAAMLAVGWACYRDATGGPRPRRLRTWDLPRMVEHLRGSGLELRVVGTAKGGALGRSAFLTGTDKGWDELNSLPKLRSELWRWRGSLFVQRGPDDETWDVSAEAWGDTCLVAGPFIFFGDPDLLARVRDALGPDVTERP